MLNDSDYILINGGNVDKAMPKTISGNGDHEQTIYGDHRGGGSIIVLNTVIYCVWI